MANSNWSVCLLERRGHKPALWDEKIHYESESVPEMRERGREREKREREKDLQYNWANPQNEVVLSSLGEN